MKVIFLGTPDFAVASLQALMEHGYEVVAVVTAPDKPAGRGQKLQQSAVKQYAVAHQIPVLQPTNLKNETFLAELQSFQADIQVVVAFRMLPERVWNMPPLGTINVHASLLPQYRGAAPINHAIIQGETITGVTTFKLQHEIDTGPILASETVHIYPEQNAGELHDVLMEAGARTLIATLKGIENESIVPKEQQFAQTLKTAPKLNKAFCEINWNQPLATVFNHIRGLSPYPAAYTYLHQKVFKIYKAIQIPMVHDLKAGTLQTDGKTYLQFATPDGFIQAVEIQLEGKKRMGIEEFLRGAKIEA